MSSSSSLGGPSSAKEKRTVHLGSYSQILGKEAGGLSKQDLSGVVFAWGTESNGQLGLDILNPGNGQPQVNLKVLYPRMIVSLKDEIIKEVCCGHSHTLVTNIHGQVFVWGLNENGQLGLGHDAPQTVKKPILNPYLSNIVKLSAGNEHSLAVNKNSELYIWGAAGLTGLGDIKMRPIPSKMDFFNKSKIAQAVCGGLHTIAITKEGDIFSWGSTEGGQLGLSLSMIQQICVNQDQPVLTPQFISNLQGVKIEQIACGEAHSLAMDVEGRIYGWGMSNYGQLGLGFSSDSFEPGIGMEKSKVYQPQQITHLKNERIIKLYCGATFSLFQTDKGDLYGCGMNDLGQLGLDTQMEDLNMATLERAKRGKHHHTSDVTLPTKVICFQGIPLSNVACGENHALGVSGDDKNMLWAWGMYRNGQLGLGEVSIKMNPRPVQTLCSSLISRISCGSMHSLALIGDSTQITTFSAQHYSHNNTLQNSWACDIRGLSYKIASEVKMAQDYEIPDGGEGKVKNPK